MTSEIRVRGARLHNLQNIDVTIPKGQLVVLTGVSGSGKSTLGFDILLKEGQRQYMESLGMLPFGLAHPPVDAIEGLAPTISIDQHANNHSPRSTVGTITDVYTYLRVLYARLGRRPCPHCGAELPAGGWLEEDLEQDSAAPEDEGDAEAAEEAAFACPTCGSPAAVLGMAHFSFNKPAGACPTCTGLGVTHEVDLPRLLDETRSIPQGAVLGWDAGFAEYHLGTLAAAAAYYGFSFEPDQLVAEYPPHLRDFLLYGADDARFRRHYPDREPPATVRQGRFEGLITSFLRRYADRITDAAYREKMEASMVLRPCPDCAGTRLRPESRAVLLDGRSIVELCRLPLRGLRAWLESLGARLRGEEQAFAAAILENLQTRIARLEQVGAGYLALERGAPSLSAGEMQRLRLAGLLGSALSGLLYVFDEPTIGLHQRDTDHLIGVLRRLRDLGNTVLVIEHDLEMIAAADTLIDFGPGAGRHGGQVVACGTPQQVIDTPASLTGAYLSGRARIAVPAQRRAPGGMALTIHGARHNNLKNLTVRLPLGLLVAVTGVAGSGKSSLIFDILDRALRRRLYGAGDEPGQHERLEGADWIERVITIDQQQAGRLPRSNAATYSDAFTPIRAAFAATPEAQALGLSARHFSFNTPGGRCERCQGAGVLAVKMHFLPDVEVRCPTCRGRRYTRAALSAHYNGVDISEVLEMTVEEALALFAALPAVRSRLQALADVGLGYLQLGQPASTLSGGEAQRVKLAKELGRRGGAGTLYLLDEPTTGLHIDDTARLLAGLQALVQGGSSVIVVEHNLELVKAADWVIDLGPEGGEAGGTLLAQGTPEQVAAAPGSLTGQWLAKLL